MAWLPKTLRIGYETYTVIPMASTAEDEGSFSSEANTIKAKVEGRGSRAIANTLLHEILHGIFYQSGLGETCQQEEAVVNSLANGLSQVMRDNPEAMRRILKMATSK